MKDSRRAKYKDIARSIETLSIPSPSPPHLKRKKKTKYIFHNHWKSHGQPKYAHRYEIDARPSPFNTRSAATVGQRLFIAVGAVCAQSRQRLYQSQTGKTSSTSYGRFPPLDYEVVSTSHASGRSDAGSTVALFPQRPAPQVRQQKDFSSCLGPLWRLSRAAAVQRHVQKVNVGFLPSAPCINMIRSFLSFAFGWSLKEETCSEI